MLLSIELTDLDFFSIWYDDSLLYDLTSLTTERSLQMIGIFSFWNSFSLFLSLPVALLTSFFFFFDFYFTASKCSYRSGLNAQKEFAYEQGS